MRFSLFERIDTESGLYVICDTTLNWWNTFTFQVHKWHYSGVIKVSRLAFAPFLWVTTHPDVVKVCVFFKSRRCCMWQLENGTMEVYVESFNTKTGVWGAYLQIWQDIFSISTKKKRTQGWFMGSKRWFAALNEEKTSPSSLLPEAKLNISFECRISVDEDNCVST